MEAALGITLVGWTVEVSQGAASSNSAERIADDIITHGGAAPIVLFHDLHWQGRSAKLTGVVDTLRARGYEPDVLP